MFRYSLLRTARPSHVYRLHNASSISRISASLLLYYW